MKPNFLMTTATISITALLLAACAGPESSEPEASAAGAYSGPLVESSGPEGSTTTFSSVQDLEAPASPLDFALFEAYMDLAESRYYSGDEESFVYFADRAIAVASGDDVSPDIIDPNILPEGEVDDLAAVRRRLLDAQTQSLVRAYNPNRVDLLNQAARAQVMFDCRMREIRLGAVEGVASPCSTGLTTSLARLEVALDSGVGGVGEPVTFVLYFDENSTELDIMAKAVIAEAEAAARKLKGSSITIVGASNAETYNAYGKVLTSLRTQVVADQLELGGLPVKLDTEVSADDLVPAALAIGGGDDPERNRRVELKIE